MDAAVLICLRRMAKMAWYTGKDLDRRGKAAIRKWKKYRSGQCCRNALGLVLVVALLLFLCVTSEALTWTQILFIGAMGVAAAALCVYSLSSAWAYKHAAIERYTYGYVEKKERFSENDRIRRYKYRAYFLTVRIDTQTTEAACDMNTYKQVKIHDRILVFDTGAGELHAIDVT